MDICGLKYELTAHSFNSGNLGESLICCTTGVDVTAPNFEKHMGAGFEMLGLASVCQRLTKTQEWKLLADRVDKIWMIERKISGFNALDNQYAMLKGMGVWGGRFFGGRGIFITHPEKTESVKQYIQGTLSWPILQKESE